MKKAFRTDGQDVDDEMSEVHDLSGLQAELGNRPVVMGGAFERDDRPDSGLQRFDPAVARQGHMKKTAARFCDGHHFCLGGRFEDHGRSACVLAIPQNGDIQDSNSRFGMLLP